MSVRRSLSRPAVLCALLLGSLAADRAQALRLVNYNLLNYPGSSGSARAQYFRTVLAPVGADVIVAEEINSAAGPAQFLAEVLEVLEPGEWATVPFVDGNDTDNTLFYKTAKLDFLGQSAFYPNQADPVRLIHAYRLRPDGYAARASEIWLYTAHLKASTGFEDQRLLECIGLRDSMNAMPAGTHALVSGDLNFYRQSTEPGYHKLLEDQANDIGRVYDLLPSGDWHDAQVYAIYHTQSPCKDGTCASGAATGGMDDRFDFILPTYNLGTGQGLSIIPNTCRAVGNDGLHLNLNITDAPTIPEGAAYATALKLASDHLPVRLDLQLPAILDLATELAFDPVVVGAAAPEQDLAVGNLAEPPADALDCSFAAPDGFGAPGPMAVAAGSWAAATITMSAATVGARAGDLVVSTDAPDAPVAFVALSGIVLDHAAASLDSTAVVLSAEADFGDHEPGTFSAQIVRAHNFGFDPLQARLSLESGAISGGGGRFAIDGGFQGSLVGAESRAFTLTFDDAGAPVDSTYAATLVFTSADEPLPGAAAQPDLVVALRARVAGGTAAATEEATPSVTRLHAARPNPMVERTALHLDMARGGAVEVGVFDASGRCLRSLHAGALPAGRHALRWDGRDREGAAVPSGVYFVRMALADEDAQAVRLIVVR